MKKTNKEDNSRHVRIFDTLTGWVDVKPGAFGLEMSSHSSLIMHGCSKVEKYTVESVAMKTGCGLVTISGHKLVCVAFRDGSVSIKGRITSICFEEDKK